MWHRLKTVWAPIGAALAAVLVAGALTTHGPPAQAAGTAQVSFVEPERYSDVGRTALERERTLKTLADHLQQLAARLPDGQALRIEVLDVDLAGEQGSMRPNDTRVMRGSNDWPRMRLRWSLQDGSRTLRSGEDQLSDINYLTTGRTREALEGELSYDKRMLDRWFADRFGTAR